MDTLSSPTHFYTIPNELVSNIFLLCSRTSAKTFQDRYRFPVTLLLTSRHWHDVATTTPGLWTDIWIRRIGSLEHAQTRIQRSGALPLTMEVDIGDHVNDQLNLILPHVARWHSIQFTFPDITALLLTHSMLPPVAPQLDHLTLTATYHRKLRTAPFLPDAMQMPNLRCLTLSQINTNWLKWPVKDLEEITISCQSSFDAVQMANTLSQSTALRRLSFRGLNLAKPADTGLQTLRSTSLENLEELRIEKCGPELVAAFMQMETPSLRSLRVAYEGSCSFDDQLHYHVQDGANLEERPKLRNLSLHYIKSGRSLFDFLSRLAPKVDHLAASSDVLENLLPHHFPKLRNLTSVDATPERLHSLLKVPGSWPELKSLNIHLDNVGLASSGSETSFNELLGHTEFLRSRATVELFGTIAPGPGFQRFASWKDKLEGCKLTDSDATIDQQCLWL